MGDYLSSLQKVMSLSIHLKGAPSFFSNLILIKILNEPIINILLDEILCQIYMSSYPLTDPTFRIPCKQCGSRSASFNRGTTLFVM